MGGGGGVEGSEGVWKVKYVKTFDANIVVDVDEQVDDEDVDEH